AVDGSAAFAAGHVLRAIRRNVEARRHRAGDLPRRGRPVTDDVRNDTAAELRQAEDCLIAAEHLLRLKLPAQAAGRIYYAAFHAARALLFSSGIAPRSHEALRSMFALHFVKAGKMPAAHSRALSELEGLRGSGDDDPNFALAADDMTEDLETARAFVADARRLLKL